MPLSVRRKVVRNSTPLLDVNLTYLTILTFAEREKKKNRKAYVADYKPINLIGPEQKIGLMNSHLIK